MTTDRLGHRPLAPRPRGLTAALLGATASLACLAGVGCDQGVAAVYADRSQLESAAELIASAQRGLVAPGVDADAARAEQLAQARTQLQPLSTSSDPATKAGALRLLAGVQTATAREQTRAADLAYAGISAAGANLSHQLAAIDAINQVILAHTGDGRTIEQALVEGAATIEQSRSAVTQRIAELGARREAQLEAARAAHEHSKAALEQARQADEAGFAADDIEQKEKALRAAYAAQIAGEAARLEAQTAEIAAQRIASEQAPLQSESQLWARMAERLASLQEQHSAETTARRDTRTAGEQNRTVELDGLGEAWAALRSDFTGSVTGPLDAAVAAAQEAVGQLGQAGSLTQERSGKQSLAFSRFAAEMELINALSQQAGTAQAFADMGQSIADSPALAGGDAAPFTADRDALTAQASQAAAKARELIASSKAFAGELAGDPQLGAVSATFVRALDSYAARLPAAN